MLIFGLGLLSGAILLFGLAPGFWWLVPLSIAAGLGNCVFHPADYAIMNARVGADRLGRAYSAHSLAGNIGWVAAPASDTDLTIEGLSAKPQTVRLLADGSVLKSDFTGGTLVPLFPLLSAALCFTIYHLPFTIHGCSGIQFVWKRL